MIRWFQLLFCVWHRNTRPPTSEESRTIAATCGMMQVKCFGELHEVLHCDEDVVVTLREVFFVPGRWYELRSLNAIQNTEDVALDKTGGQMLRGRVRFGEERNGNSVTGWRWCTAISRTSWAEIADHRVGVVARRRCQT